MVKWREVLQSVELEPCGFMDKGRERHALVPDGPIGVERVRGLEEIDVLSARKA
jgi:hypothetical protein